MNGLAWQPANTSEVIPRELRGFLILAVVAGIHFVPAMTLTLSAHTLPVVEETPISFEMVDLPPDPFAAIKPPESENKPELKPEPGQTQLVQVPPPEKKPPETAAAKPPVAEAIPVPPTVKVPPPPPVAPESAKPEIANTPAKKLPAAPSPVFEEKTGVAFDESKAIGEAPKNAYLSDRTSSAADRGPKNLPRGDPYMNKGLSKEVLYNEIRGEGNLAPIATNANSGSVKKEGSADAGKGPDDKRLPEEKAPPVRIALKDDTPQKGLADLDAKPAIPGGVDNIPARPIFPDIDKPEIKVAKATPPKPPEEVLKNDLFGSAPEVAETKKIELVESKPVPTNLPPPPNRKIEVPQQKGENAIPAVALPKKKEPTDELDAFKALLDGSGKTDARGGNAGDKPGINARDGKKGHEGNGSARPGHEDAVSDVTTLNLDTSAEETDDARFGKKYDPLSTYFKKIARRIDGKWKAELAARSRVRVARGVVYIRLIVRRDGKLMEATEAKREPAGTPDEYVNAAIIAVKAAAEPTSDPFPHDLQDHETLERVFQFIYN